MKCNIRNLNEIIFISDRKNISEITTKFYNLEKAIAIVKEFDGLRIVFEINSIQASISDIKLLCETYKNIVFKCNNYEDMKLLKENEIPFFAAHSLYFADTLDKLVHFCKSGVTDVYITGELGFKTKVVRSITDAYKVKIRAFPNMVQHSGFLDSAHMDSICGFWIKPNDLDVYEGIIDIIEFHCEDKDQDLLYDIYYSGSYQGDLALVVKGLDPMNINSLPKEFTQFRVDCEKRCHMSKCHKCYKFKALSEVMNFNNLEVDEES